MRKIFSFLLPVAIVAVISLQSCGDNTTTNSTPSTQSLYTRLGGSAAIDTVVAVFINNVAADPQINFFFAPVLADTTGVRHYALATDSAQSNDQVRCMKNQQAAFLVINQTKSTANHSKFWHEWLDSFF